MQFPFKKGDPLPHTKKSDSLSLVRYQANGIDIESLPVILDLNHYRGLFKLHAEDNAVSLGVLHDVVDGFLYHPAEGTLPPPRGDHPPPEETFFSPPLSLPPAPGCRAAPGGCRHTSVSPIAVRGH